MAAVGFAARQWFGLSRISVQLRTLMLTNVGLVDAANNASCNAANFAQLSFRPAEPGRLKQIVRRAGQDGTLTIEAVPSTKESTSVVLDLGKHSCPLCSLNMNIHYTDVLIIKQFVKPDGGLLPRRVTGLCAKQHLVMARLVHKAQNAGLLKSLKPASEETRKSKQYRESQFTFFKGLKRYFTDNYK